MASQWPTSWRPSAENCFRRDYPLWSRSLRQEGFFITVKWLVKNMFFRPVNKIFFYNLWFEYRMNRHNHRIPTPTVTTTSFLFNCCQSIRRTFSLNKIKSWFLNYMLIARIRHSCSMLVKDEVFTYIDHYYHSSFSLLVFSTMDDKHGHNKIADTRLDPNCICLLPETFQWINNKFTA